MEFHSAIKRMDVMMVDPDIVSRGNLGALARDFGCYLVRPFEDAEKAVVSIVSKPPAVVICNAEPDEQLAMSILEHTRLHALDSVARTPIIVMSRQMDRKTMSRFLMMGATQVLNAPVVPAELMSKLVFVLKDSRAMVRQNGRLAYVAPPTKKVGARQANINVVEFPVKSKPCLAKKQKPKPDDILEL